MASEPECHHSPGRGGPALPRASMSCLETPQGRLGEQVDLQPRVFLDQGAPSCTVHLCHRLVPQVSRPGIHPQLPGSPSPRRIPKAALPQPLLVSRAVLLGVFRASPFSLWPLASLPAPAPVPSPTRLVSARGQRLCLGTPPCQPGAASHVVQTQAVSLSRSFSSSPRCRELHPCPPTRGSVLGEVRAGAGLGPAELPQGLGAGQQDLPASPWPCGLELVALPRSLGCLAGVMWLLGLAEASGAREAGGHLAHARPRDAVCPSSVSPRSASLVPCGLPAHRPGSADPSSVTATPNQPRGLCGGP